jgi:hypothetical protein
MQDVSIRELMGSASQKVLAHDTRLGVDQGHRILQLIPEAEGSS